MSNNSLNNASRQTEQEVSLVVLAAGLGSRFGGDKQLAGLGPDSMPLMYYNLLDAHAAGIRHLVLILRRELVALVESEFLPALPGDIQVDIAVQSVDQLPPGFNPQGREKPWGTAHALWCARHLLSDPFITANADDYYGADAIQLLAGHLRTSPGWALACYSLAATLSDHGGVNRGLCSIQGDYLTGIEECLQIQRQGERLVGRVGPEWRELLEDEPVSMNLWGFTPTIFAQLEQGLRLFLPSAGPETEFLLPDQVLAGIENGLAQVRAYHTGDNWLGITYPEDLAMVDAALATRSGI